MKRLVLVRHGESVWNAEARIQGQACAGLSERGPASKTGLKPGDRIVAVRDEPISTLASFWRRVWASGPAGSEVVLQIARDKETRRVRIPSADRSSFLKAPKLH